MVACARNGTRYVASTLVTALARALSTSPMFCATAPVWTVIPFDHQRRQSFLRSPHVVGHDRDGVVEAYDLTHTFDGLGLCIIHALHTAAEDGRLRKRRDLHARRPRVDAIDRATVDLRRCVQTLGRGADELEIPDPFQRDAFRRRQRKLRSVGNQCAVLETSTTGHVDD